MRSGWLISILMHGALFAMGMMAFKNIKTLDAETRIIPVEMITISELTNIRASIERDIPDVSESPTQSEISVKNANEQGDPQERSTDNPMSQTRELVPDGEAPNMPTPDRPAFNLDEMSALVDRARTSQTEVDQQIANPGDVNIIDYTLTTREGVGEGTELTMDEVTALQRAMKDCWNEPVAAQNPEELAVRMRIFLRSDGHVTKIESLDRKLIERSNNPFLNAAENNARSAIWECAPYDFLPVSKYDKWNDIILTFAPEN